MTDTVFFKHHVGDGIHYVTDNFHVFRDGSFQLGDTSENSILYSLHLICGRNRIPGVPDLWNTAYPSDVMAIEDFAYILYTGMSTCEKFSPTAPDDIYSVLDDVRAIGCDALADEAERLLKNKGVISLP